MSLFAVVPTLNVSDILIALPFEEEEPVKPKGKAKVTEVKK